MSTRLSTFLSKPRRHTSLFPRSSLLCGPDWGLDHSYPDGDVNNDVWIPGSTSLSATYDDGVTTGTIDFTFSYT